jgi:putative spermidine/putrescine transport system permease protein
VLGLYFVAPIAASVLFTVRDRGRGGLTAEHYTGIPTASRFAESFGRSLALGALTVVLVLLLMVPTVVLVELRLPRLRTTVELLTLMPLVLPPIALVVGVRSVLSWAPDYFFGTPLADASSPCRGPRCHGSSCWSTWSWRCRSSTGRWTPVSAGPTCAG